MLQLMIFTIVALVLIGGFIVLFPLTRRLGQFLEHRMAEASRPREIEDRANILKAIESLRADVAHLAERQTFTERLLERPRSRYAPDE